MATAAHCDFWRTLDAHLPPAALEAKLASGMCRIITDAGRPVGILRYGLFWDTVAFLNLIYLADASRRRGLGRRAMGEWEAEMAEMGHTAVMTSTQADEQAQHFYRALGYADCGCLILGGTTLGQPAEIFFVKDLKSAGQAARPLE